MIAIEAKKFQTTIKFAYCAIQTSLKHKHNCNGHEEGND
jgi:hypothetical protein